MASTIASVLDYIVSALSSLSYTTDVLVVVAAASIAYYIYMNTCHDDWTRYGVRCPKLTWFFFFRSNFRALFTELFTQYGDTIGIHSRARLMLLTTNFDLLRHILIKDFNNFVNRGDGFLSRSPFARSLFFARDYDWRRHRRIVSPTFSTGKLKHISKSIDKSAQDLTAYLEKYAQKGELVPIKEICGQYTCEIIAKTAFGLDDKFIGQDDIEFFEYAKTMLRLNTRTGIWRMFFVLLSTVPHLMKLTINTFKMQYFDSVDIKADNYFGVTLKNTIAERRQQQKKGVERPRTDFLDLLLKANDEAAAGKLKATEEEFKAHEEKSVQSLSEEEMIGQSMLVIFAGMETTATTLQMCLYELAANPDIQEKVFQEIASVVKGESPTPEELNSLNYTEQVIDETLRMYTPVPSVNRMAKKTRTYAGVTIPKGTVVNIPYFYILRDPKIFPEPDRFDPNRFSPEERDKRDPLSFPAFGHGPRLCLGMRLAYMELKQALVHILRQLRVVVNEKTEPPVGARGIKITVGGLLTPEKPIMLAFELRQGSG